MSSKKFKQPAQWKRLQRHALSAEYKDITGDRWEELVVGLKTYGFLPGHEIVLCEGKVLDGWQRLRACIEANVKPTFKGPSRGISPENYVHLVNDPRRHETPEDRAERVAKRQERVAAARVEGQSLRAIAEAEGISHTQVADDIKASGVNPVYTSSNEGDENSDSATPAEASEPPKVTGRDGKTYPAKKPRVLCDRCQRVAPGIGVPNCTACKEAASAKPSANGTPTEREPGDDTEEIEAEKERSKTIKNGAPLYSRTKFDSSYGALVREIDVLGNAYREKETPAAEALRKQLTAFNKAFWEWHSDLKKRAAKRAKA